MSIARILRSRFMVKILFVPVARLQDQSSSTNYYAAHEVLHKPFTRRQLRKALSGFLS